MDSNLQEVSLTLTWALCLNIIAYLLNLAYVRNFGKTFASFERKKGSKILSEWWNHVSDLIENQVKDRFSTVCLLLVPKGHIGVLVPLPLSTNEGNQVSLNPNTQK